MLSPIQRIKQYQFDRLVDKAQRERTSEIAGKLAESISSGTKLDITSKTKSGNMVRLNKALGRKNTLSKDSTYQKGNIKYNRNNITVISPYNYEIIDKHRSKESYFGRSLNKQIETIMRNGYNFVSDNDDFVAIINKQFTYLSIESGTSLNHYIAKIAENLSLYGICFIEKIRSGNLDGTVKGLRFDEKPITNIMIHSPQDTKVELNSVSNRLLKFYKYYRPSFKRQNAGEPREIEKYNIAVSRLMSCEYEFYPEPACFSMLEDILSLRSLEETVEILSSQFSSPLLHAKIGSDTFPATDPQVESIYSAIVNMAPNGFIATNHTVEITSVNLQNSMADLIGYIEHFKNRVLVGSGSSPISVGEADTTNRNSADTINNSLADHCSYIADAIVQVFDYNIIPDILLNSGISPDKIVGNDGLPVVRLIFNETDLDKQIAKNNHAMALFQSNSITHDELRRELKKSPMTEQQLDNTMFNLFPGKSNENAVNSNNTPQNQYGIKQAPGTKKD